LPHVDNGLDIGASRGLFFHWMAMICFHFSKELSPTGNGWNQIVTVGWWVNSDLVVSGVDVTSELEVKLIPTSSLDPVVSAMVAAVLGKERKHFSVMILNWVFSKVVEPRELNGRLCPVVAAAVAATKVEAAWWRSLAAVVLAPTVLVPAGLAVGDQRL
jgi:hypothetical protein